MNENITKRMDNQESDPRSWIERWKGTADNIITASATSIIYSSPCHDILTCGWLVGYNRFVLR